MIKWISIVGSFLLIAAGGYFITQCPCERIPGLWLLGEEGPEPATWEFANQERLCQIEVSSWYTHSVNLNCMASEDGLLYLSCSRCDGKRWSTAAVDSGRARIRIGELVYPVSIRRVTDSDELDKAWKARYTKLKREPSPRPDHWWSFNLTYLG